MFCIHNWSDPRYFVEERLDKRNGGVRVKRTTLVIKRCLKCGKIKIIKFIDNEN